MLYKEGYWSYLSRDDNAHLLNAVKHYPARQALKIQQPQLEDIIYSPKRHAGLELLKLSGNETCIDYGCMWGALTIPLANRTSFVVGIDQTIDSLKFLKARMVEERVSNVALLCADLRKLPVLENKYDIAVVNGVLEWIPEDGEIEVKSYYAKYRQRSYVANPYEQQREFLRTVHENLTDQGKLYLAIENRYEFKMFLGAKDRHAGIRFVSVLPRRLSDAISMTQLGRPYRSWLYSFASLKRLMNEAGFSRVDLYMCFPDYRYPERIIPFGRKIANYHAVISPRNSKGKISFPRLVARALEVVTFGILKLRRLSPSIIAIGHK
jgi:hypothetical protein